MSGPRDAGDRAADDLPAAGEADDGSQDRIERARRRERGATRKLHERIRRSEELYAQAARMLAALDASVEATRALLRRMGYLGESERRHGPRR